METPQADQASALVPEEDGGAVEETQPEDICRDLLKVASVLFVVFIILYIFFKCLER